MSLSNSQYESIMRDYEEIRDRNRDLLQKRRAEVYEKCPDVQSLEEEIASASVREAKLLLMGDDEALARLKTTLGDISRKKRTLLEENGFSPDYLKEIYSCDDCRDTGYLTSPDGVKTKCHCFRKKEVELLYARSHIQGSFQESTFLNLSYDYHTGEDLTRFQGAVKISMDFVKNFKEDYHNLLFYGTVGTGKSFLSGCIANELLQRENFVLYFSAANFFDTLARYTFDEGRSRNALDDFCADAYDCDLLIIDDLGTETNNSFVSSQLFICLNERHLRGKATIISTNLNLKELQERYSDRVFSRISSTFDLCKLTGDDIRIKKKLHQS